MPFWSLEERISALTPPSHIFNHYGRRTRWIRNRRLELGFGEEKYGTGIEFCRSNSKTGTAWLLRDLNKHFEIIRNLHIEDKGDERAGIKWEVDHHEAGLLAEGVAANEEEAWAEACKVAGTDRLEIGAAGTIASLKKARNKLKEFDRLAGLNPSENDAQPMRFVFARSYWEPDGYGLTSEYRARLNRFCYRRYRLVKETAKFYFCDLLNPEDIDRDGVVDEEMNRFRHRRGDVPMTRIPKALWDSPELDLSGNPMATGGRYVRNAPYGVSTVWLSLEELVREKEDADARFRSGLLHSGMAPENWMTTLGLEAYGGDQISELSMRDLQRHYRRAVMEAHPDKGGTAERFQQVQVAYEHAKKVLAGRF